MTRTIYAFATALVAACSGTTTSPDQSEADSGVTPTGDSGSGQDAGSTGTSTSTAGVECGYSYSGYNDSPSVMATSTATWTCTSTTRSLTANGIPDHAVGTFPNANCPNTITTQDISATMTLTPVDTGTASPIQIVGYAFNGVKFDPSTAGTCSETDAGATCSLIGNTGNWNIEALGQSSFDFGVDSNNAHVQPSGWYHYHGVPEGVLTKLAKGEAPTLVGYALDGFPVYARYGYSSPMDSTSAVKVITGSYQIKSTPDAGRPSTDTYPMGAFTQDYEYVAGSGDLDECNGRTDVTPEFPTGIYHYYITDSYPFIQRCVKGTATSSGEGGPPPGDGGMMMGPPPGDGGMMGPPNGG